MTASISAMSKLFQKSKAKSAKHKKKRRRRRSSSSSSSSAGSSASSEFDCWKAMEKLAARGGLGGDADPHSSGTEDLDGNLRNDSVDR